MTCGHELTSQLNAVRRATTVALNADSDPAVARADDARPGTLASLVSRRR